MLALDFLAEGVVINKKLLTARMKEDRCRETAERIAASIKRCGVQRTLDVSVQETAILSYVEASDEANRLENERTRILNKIDDMLGRLNTNHGAAILRKHYLEGRTITDIAREEFIARQFVYTLKDRALAELNRLLEVEIGDRIRQEATAGDMN
ncbi:MAG: hypothetical protein Q4C54_04715 [Clostridia bacterium]|nr:hypothetical protein [Clostridia bacterium]